MAKTYDDFLEVVRNRESHNNYTAKNSYGFLGAYQLGEEGLTDAGFYAKDGTKANDWIGSWTQKAQDMGISSQADFIGAKTDDKGNIVYEKVKLGKKEVSQIVKDPSKMKKAKEAQDAAVKSYYVAVWNYICHYQLDVDYVGKEINGVKVVKAIIPMSADVVKDIAFQLKGEIPANLFVVIGSVDNNKPMLTVMISEDLVKAGQNAGKLVREAAKLIQGGGGGQPHFATAGGKNPDGLNAAVDKVLELAAL